MSQTNKGFAWTPLNTEYINSKANTVFICDLIYVRVFEVG